MKVVFFGSSKFIIPILEVLRKNFEISLVLTTERLAFQGLAWEAPVIKYCMENKIPYLSVQQFNNSTIGQLKTIKSPVAVLADFGLIIPKEILNAFPKGIINIHPSLLPKYRGPTPVQTAILEGVKETGVSIMKLDEEIDHGPILAQTEEQILETDTAESLYQRLFNMGADLLPKTLKEYLEGNLKPKAQNHEKATFTKLLARADGYIDISYNDKSFSLEKLNRMIRAYYPWPGVWTNVQTTSNKKQLTTNVKESEVRSQKLEVRIKFLPGNLIQVEGKKPVDIETFKRGYPEARQRLEKLLGQLE